MTQPMVIEELISGNGGLARGIGMLARFLICWPESTIGQRLYVEGDLDAEELRAFDARVTELLGMPLPVRDEISMILEPPILELDPEAFAMWRKFYDGSERDLGRHGEYAELTDFGAKIAEQAARIAGVMHVFEHGPVGQISAETMESACTIAGWHLYEARRVFGLIEIDRATQDAQLLLEWLEGQPTPPTLKIMAQFAPFRLRSKSRRDQAIDKLAAHGIARLESRDGSTVMVLNPAWRS
jgi:putative DNA primase/helicase